MMLPDICPSCRIHPWSYLTMRPNDYRSAQDARHARAMDARIADRAARDGYRADARAYADGYRRDRAACPPSPGPQRGAYTAGWVASIRDGAR